ncbi:MAG: nicotinamide-nucleotide amidohydrolase family protein [Candidatus Krumholzibacteriota bacterium]|nr:nicotinamide-nucleotide amidohydrolase family protein [Candidatus Krumholzibacteriota bacterium]
MAADRLDLRPRLVAPVRLAALGDELLRGERADTNSPWLAARLAALGHPVASIVQVPDRRGAAADLLARWREEGGTLVVGGGLGPTPDDATREEIATGLGVPLVEHPRAAAWIREREARLERRFGPGTLRQALLPAGCEPVFNPLGTAPGICHAAAGRLLLVLPGVPHEYRAICEAVFPLDAAAAAAEDWTLSGLGEDRLAGELADFPGREALGFYPNLAQGHRLRVPLAGVDREALAARLAPWLVSQRGESLAAVVLDLLRARGETLAVAESCTGGLLGARLTAVPGASDVFLGGVVSYADTVKTRLLDVPAGRIADDGAVSEAVARAMARGARARLDGDWALAVTGIAGPGGARPGKPVGTLHLALAGPGVERHERHQAGWDRDGNRDFAVRQALTLLWRSLREAP